MLVLYELILLTAIYVHLSLHFANQFILHWNMLQAQSTFTSKDHAQTKLATKAQALTEQVIMMSTSVQTTALTKKKLQCTYWNNWSRSSPSSQVAPFPPSSYWIHSSPFLVELSYAWALHFPPESLNMMLLLFFLPPKLPNRITKVTHQNPLILGGLTIHPHIIATIPEFLHSYELHNKLEKQSQSRPI